MRRRALLMCGLFAGVVLLLCGAVWLMLPRYGITVANAERISPGMTQEDVEAIFGVPPGEYGRFQHPRAKHPAWKTWTGDTVAAQVKFDGEGRVNEVTVQTADPEPRRSILDIVRTLLRL